MAIDAESEEGNGIPAVELGIRIAQMLPVINEALGDAIDAILNYEPGAYSIARNPGAQRQRPPGLEKPGIWTTPSGRRDPDTSSTSTGGDFDSPPASRGAPAPDGQRTEPTPGSSGGDFGGGSGGGPGDEPAPPPAQGARPTDPKNHPGGAGDGSGGDHGNDTTTGNPDTQPDSGGAAERTPEENAAARNYFKNNKDAARQAWEQRTGQKWPTDANGNPWPAEHTPPLKSGGDPMNVYPRDPGAPDPHNIPGPDGLTDYQRWGAQGTPARQANQ